MKRLIKICRSDNLDPIFDPAQGYNIAAEAKKYNKNLKGIKRYYNNDGPLGFVSDNLDCVIELYYTIKNKDVNDTKDAVIVKYPVTITIDKNIVCQFKGETSGVFIPYAPSNGDERNIVNANRAMSEAANSLGVPIEKKLNTQEKIMEQYNLLNKPQEENLI